MGLMNWLRRHVIIDAWGEPEPENCHARAVWTAKRYRGDEKLYLVHGLTKSKVGHTELWTVSDGHAEPFGRTLLNVAGAQILDIERIEAGTGDLMVMTEPEHRQALELVRTARRH